MQNKLTYNCNVLDDGTFVTSADLSLKDTSGLNKSSFHFILNQREIKVDSFSQRENEMNFVFQISDDLAILKFDPSKFVNAKEYPNIILKIDGKPSTNFEQEFVDDPYIKDFNHFNYTNGVNQLSYYKYERYSDKKRPLVIFLHGSGERGYSNKLPLLGNDVPKTFHDYIQQHEESVLLVPQATWSPELNGWFRRDVRSTLINLIKDTIKSDNIDPNRVYLAGLSNGGAGTWHFAEQHPNLFAAIIPCCGYIYNDDKEFIEASGKGRYMKPTESEAVKLKDMPVWAFHASDDPTVNSEGTIKTISLLKKIGNNKVRETIYDKGVVTPNAHASWKLAYNTPELLPWLFSQSKKG